MLASKCFDIKILRMEGGRMFPVDVHTQNLIHRDRVERLRLDGRPGLKKQRPVRPERPVPRLRPAPNRFAV
jgi:hypothetical protein